MELFKMNKLMNVKEAAKYLRVNHISVYKMVKHKRIPATRMGGSWRFKKDLLDEWLNRNTMSGNGTILIVDDDVEGSSLLKAMIQKQSCSVYIANSGEAAVAQINQQHFDVVILDVKLAGKNVLKTIKDKALEAIIAIGIENNDDLKAVKNLPNGPVLLVKKPYQEKDILEVVNMVIKGRN
jgi:excisionase family DNA binding protein